MAPTRCLAVSVAGAETTSQLLVPAPMVPMTAQVGSVVGDDHEVEGPRRDDPLAARTEVFLHRLVGLYRVDGYPEKIAHAMTASIARIATTTMTMSSVLFSCSRKGLKPTPQTVTPVMAIYRHSDELAPYRG